MYLAFSDKLSSKTITFLRLTILFELLVEGLCKPCE